MADKKENEKDFNLIEKKRHAIFLLLIIFIPMSIALFVGGQFFIKKNRKDREALDTGVLSNIVSHMNTMSLAALNQYNTNLAKRMEVTVSFLKEDVTNGEYTGERVLNDGFVIKLDGNKIIFPEGAPEGNMKISAQMIRDSIDSGMLRTGRLTVDDDTTDTTESASDSSDSTAMTEADDLEIFKEQFSSMLVEEVTNVLEQEISSTLPNVIFGSSVNSDAILTDYDYALSFAPITENDIYVAVTSEAAFGDYVSLYTKDAMSALENAAEIAEGMVVLISDTDGELAVMDSYGELEGKITEFPESNLSQENLGTEKSDKIILNGKTFRYICVEADASFLDAEKLYILQIFPSHSTQSQMLLQSVMICLLMLLILLTLIVYTLSEQHFVVENVMTKEEAIRYSPRKLRRKLSYAGMVGALAIFLLAFMTQTVGQLHQQIRYAEYTLQLLSGTVEQSVVSQQEEIKEYQEQWYADTCTYIAYQLTQRPELTTQEKLAELSALLGSEFLMVFDSAGREYVSSNDYTGFTLTHGLGSDASDFHSLLMGIPCIIHEPSIDKITRQERQFIGVTMDAVDDPTSHGALVISLYPQQTDVAGRIVDIGDEMGLTMNSQAICFYASESDGMIIDSTKPALEGRTIHECGLSDSSLQDGYMDFGVIDEEHLFIITKKSGDSIFYYAAEYGSFMKQNLIFSLICTLLYLVTLIFTIHGLMQDYNNESYRKWTTVLLPSLPAKWKTQASDDSSVFDDDSKKSPLMKIRRRNKNQSTEPKRPPLISLISQLVQWDNRLPEEKANLVFYVGMFAIMLVWLCMILVSNDDISLLNYLFYGDWKRGLNAFSLYCIILILVIGNLVITISSWILHLFSGFLSSKGETICNLLRSIIKYITIIAVIFISLSYFGLLNSTVIASVGLGSVILSLGAKDIVADILSGILIVFEQTLRIGDIVEYDGKIGIVQEVGMRTTKLELMPANNILEVRNHEIASVINMSKYASNCILELRIRATESLEMVEDLLGDNLERIGKGCPQIIGAPRYVGVTRLGNNGTSNIALITLCISFNCSQKNYTAASTFLNKELHNLFEEKSISLY